MLSCTEVLLRRRPSSPFALLCWELSVIGKCGNAHTHTYSCRGSTAPAVLLPLLAAINAGEPELVRTIQYYAARNRALIVTGVRTQKLISEGGRDVERELNAES